MTMPRIALFSDSYHEANGVARTTAAIEACAKKRNIPLLSVHAGPETRLVHDGSIVRLDLKRSRALSFDLEHYLRVDLTMWRSLSRVSAALRWFAPDVLHFTGPSDVGQLAALLEQRTGKPAFLMSRGVDTEAFTPKKRLVPNAIVNIGYVGRLSVEKNVRVLQALEAELDAEGLDVRFTIVGDGSEREWLQRHMLRAEFTGVLRGEALAQAYAQMDIFAFPSEIDTVGNVVLEAMASGVPVGVMASGGPRFMVEPDRTAIVAADRAAFLQGVRTLVRNRARREAMGAAARARAKDLMSWDRIFLDVCSAYEAAIISGRLTEDQEIRRTGFENDLLASCPPVQVRCAPAARRS